MAVLGLMCSGTGSLQGTGLHTRWPSFAVFDAPAGHVQVLGFFFDNDFHFVPRQAHLQNGVITVAGDFLQGHDAACCPSGRATATISYRNGKLVLSKAIISSPAQVGPTASPTTPATPSAPPAVGVGRTITVTGYDGKTYVATVRAEDTVTDCAANSYGAPVIQFFRQHPCHDAGRRLVTIPFNGRTVALSMIAVDEPGAPRDLYGNAGQLGKLENESGTGSVDDLLRGGVRPAGWPARIPPQEAFVVTGEDATIEIFDAWYLDGSTADQDPALTKLTQDIFLTSITVGPF